MKGGKGEKGKESTEVAGSQFASTSSQSLTPSTQHLAERRQLTVMFCDLVGSTALSEQLDPEDLREVVRAYQETCTTVIQRYDGHLAQHLGDGLLVYFGYPAAHEDDAQRAVRTGLEIVAALQRFSPSPSQGEGRGEGSAVTQSQNTPHPSPLPKGARGLQVRIGIHTGLVVIGEIGSSEKREILALGETPNIAARVQGMAEPDTVVVSAATYRLVHGLFKCQDLGLQTLKGISIPLSVYQVQGESTTQSRFEVAVSKGLTPLVGRAEELDLLQRRWEQAKTGAGQVVLLSGEPGIGKSRLVQEFKERFAHEGATRLEFRCSPYHQNSAFYPIIEHLQRLLQFVRADVPAVKLEKLHHTLRHYRFSQSDTAPLLATLLSLPHPEGSPPITGSPQKQKEKTQAALVAWLVEEAQKAAVFCVWEDLHWVDPSTLEVLTLLLDQVPTTRLVALLTFRPEFVPPWGNRSHLSQMTLSRLGRTQVEAMVEQVTGSTALPQEVVQQIVSKTDGVPLFVEELTKMVVEAEADVGARRAVPFPLGIPSTLQDALMARLDRLGPTKEIAQLGATIGREFSYELLHAVSPVGDETLQQGLKQLMEVELVYQRGLVPQATYLFKHALIQDTAYHSLLKSKRQQYHQRIAQVLEERFRETKETQPELLAHHYTEAGLIAQAIPYWQKAGQRASLRSATSEAIAHLTKGLELLNALPDTPERTQQELELQLALAGPLVPTKGYTAPEVERVYTRALELCRQLGETPRLFWALRGLQVVYLVRAELKTARELAEQLLSLAQNVHNLVFLVQAHNILGMTLLHLGEFASAREHLEQGIAFYNPQQHDSHVLHTGLDLGVVCLTYAARALWFLGYPDQAQQRSHDALTLAYELSHPYSLGYALTGSATGHQLRREVRPVQEQRALIVLATEQGFPVYLAQERMRQGWALAVQGQIEEGISQIRQGLDAWRDMGTEVWRPFWVSLLVEAYGKGEQVEEGLTVLAEALAAGNRSEERMYEAELWRLRGELTLQRE
ncbi:MAG: AAA family ATPase, partial [Deltaproteobacteria bacterium]|nr:AAA family ATPase [Deltaproteobacteria bacterium]